jgi:hypothetical protein
MINFSCLPGYGLNNQPKLIKKESNYKIELEVEKLPCYCLQCCRFLWDWYKWLYPALVLYNYNVNPLNVNSPNNSPEF